MPKRRKDAGTRRFFDEFAKVRISRFRALGVVDPARAEAVIPFPDGKDRTIAVKHTSFAKGGGWSYFSCPGCARRARDLYLLDDAPRCRFCCIAMNIYDREHYGFGRAARLEASSKRLDERIAMLETTVPLRLKPSTQAKLVARRRSLTARVKRRMVSLRLAQLASQQAKDNGNLAITRAYKPRSQALMAIPDLAQVWQARTHERLQKALDNAQTALIQALDSDKPHIRIAAASIMLKSKHGAALGFHR